MMVIHHRTPARHQLIPPMNPPQMIHKRLPKQLILYHTFPASVLTCSFLSLEYSICHHSARRIFDGVAVATLRKSNEADGGKDGAISLSMNMSVHWAIANR